MAVDSSNRIRVTTSTLRSIIVGVLLLALGGVVGYRYGQVGAIPTRVPLSSVINAKVPDQRANSVDFSVFWEVWNDLDQTYLNPEQLDAATMVDGAIQGMTAAVGDPYTTYLPPEDNQRRAEDLAGAFYGIGIELGYLDNTLAVVAPLEGTPADQAGLQAGDLILHLIDPKKDLDEDTTGWTLNEAVEKIRGERNSTITLIITRKDADGNYVEPFEVPIQRDEIVVKSVKLEFVEHNGKRVAHLKVTTFGERTPDEFDQAVNEILANGANLDGIILDLRNNPGGYFDDAIDVASEFIEDGAVVAQQGKYSKLDFEAKGRARLANFNVEVLVNKGSASASEIVAGALRDQLGAKLIGQQTFGKGTVQDRRELSNGGGLHVTIARWLLPKGDWIHDEGIPVNVEVQDNPETEEDEALLRAIEEL